ncbi:uncharacterized protein B0H18DRAFT_885024 [Fomitopsis serialis]|uniref:uncharacterized protein n=1 Tax=Fomitopsis serialis TaxID=139415 RepID=UPI0020088B2E|nr:uncharacterized protein B0H18DRAFT_885024 [Neoantrodia serialis]KAH9916220.1 hypothetical protein B0H18DRAFT_885024 [Neoantrodia serialis]
MVLSQIALRRPRIFPASQLNLGRRLTARSLLSRLGLPSVVALGLFFVESKSEHASELLELDTAQVFGEEVCRIIVSANEEDFDLSFFN